MPVDLPCCVLLAPAVLVLAGLAFVIGNYNALVALRNHIREAWSNIDTELKRRYELIPNLVAAVQGYAAHERAVLERVTALRAQCLASTGRPGEQAADETQLVAAVKQLLAVVERYPALKADRHFLELQTQLVDTEDRIQAARRFYNGNVRDYRNRCESFPSSLVARAFGFAPEDYFRVAPVVRDVPDVDF